MKRDIAEKWAAALMSGEYKQGNGCLISRTEDGSSETYCCLGVLCDVAARDGVELTFEHLIYLRQVSVSGQQLFPPTKVWKDYAGMATNRGVIDLAEAHRTLAQMNDEYMPFEVIAQVILTHADAL